MAKLAVEVDFVAGVWNLAVHRDSRLETYARFLPPEAIQHAQLAGAYQVLLKRWATGADVTDEEATEELHQALGDLYQRVLQASYLWQELPTEQQQPREYAKRIARHWQTRKQAALLRDAAEEAKRLENLEDDGRAVRELGDRVVSDIIALHSTFIGKGAARTRKEITALERQVIHSGEEHGIAWPFRRLNTVLGPILPGKVYGITGYPGTGKTQLTVNIVRGLITRMVPCIVIPTEMEVDWQRRVWGTHAGLHQRLVEHQQWTTAHPEELARYEAAMADLEDCPWELVLDPEITVEGVIARARVLRRQYPGQHVVLVVDHMYDLQYPGGKAEELVGDATRKLRVFCQADRDGGMSAILLYQPRKPGDENAIFHPVRAHQVKGAQIWHHVYAHFSPFRRWVKTVQYERTPWGSPRVRFDDSGYPERADPDEPNSKVDDEHVYCKPDKVRSGGEGQLFMLNFDGPTGLIYENEPHWGSDPFLQHTYNRERDRLCAAS